MGVNEGVRVGREGTVNPFAVALDAYREEKRRRDEKDEALREFLFKAGQEHEFQKELIKQQSEEKIRQQKELLPLEEASTERLAGSNFEREKQLREFDFGQDVKLEREKARLQGTPIGALTAARTGGDVGQDVGIPGMSSESMGRRVDIDPNVEGDEAFIPESLSEKKTRLQVDDLERSSTPEGRARMLREELEALKKKEVVKADIAFKKAQEKEKTNAVVEIDQINSMIDSVFSKADELIPAAKTAQEGFVAGANRSFRRSGLARVLGMGEGEGERARAYKDFQDGTLSLLIRSLGERGMLTNQDIARARNFSPKFGDTIQERRDKKEAMEQFLQSKVKVFFSNKSDENSVNKTSSGLKYQIIEE